jgi:hypothetical protein
MHNHTIGIKSQKYDSRYTPKMSADIVMHTMSSIFRDIFYSL